MELFAYLFLYFSPRLENEWIDGESEKLFARFITLLGDLTYAGFNEIKLSARPETIIDIPNFVMPQPKKTGNERDREREGTKHSKNKFQVLLFAIFLHLLFFNQSFNRFIRHLLVSSIDSNVLFICFFQSTHPFLIHIVFDAISSIILADNANYFLCGENLSPLTENLYSKPNDVQTKIYDLMEFIVFQLKFIPHRELVNLSILIKSER